VQVLEELPERPELLAETLAHVGVDPSLTPEVDLAPVNSSAGDDEVLDPSIEAEVRQSFTESDRELAALLGRSLPWQDDRDEEPRR
jgi:hypothetical protein